MNSKTILYVHGFASSGQSGTVKRLRQLLPGSTVLAPDLPISPHAAVALLRETCEKEQPHLIIGTSMGGMYAEQLRGFHRILVNPALRMGETISKNHMLGKNLFLNPRLDGQKEFQMTKQLQEEYAEVAAQCFAGLTEEDARKVYGLFALEDTFVTDTCELFSAHYPNAIHFHGGHRLDDSALIHSVLPVIRWIDAEMEGRPKPILYIDWEDCLQTDGRPLPSMEKAVCTLSEQYDVYFLTKAPAHNYDYVPRATSWLFEHLGVLTYRHIVSTNRKDLLLGDYLITAEQAPGLENFMGGILRFGTPEYKTWDRIIQFFGFIS